jgi:hypothetical protein
MNTIWKLVLVIIGVVLAVFVVLLITYIWAVLFGLEKLKIKVGGWLRSIYDAFSIID